MRKDVVLCDLFISKHKRLYGQAILVVAPHTKQQRVISDKALHAARGQSKY